MKRIVIFLISMLAVFASCTKIEDTASVSLNKGTKEITFGTSAGANTKAIVEGTTMVDNFGVYGFVKTEGNVSAGGYLMRNAEYEETGTAANDAHYYWPKSDNYGEGVQFLFTAYAPFSDAVTLDESDEYGYVTIEIPELTQELINNDSDAADILWAQTLIDHHQNALGDDEKVALNFKHALSWLQFKAEVANNQFVKWVDIKSVKFEKYQEGQEAVEPNPGQEYIAPYNDTTDVWINLKKSSNAIATSTAVKGPGETSYTNAAPLPAELVAEIKSYYSIDNGAAGDYELKLGNTVWPSSVTYKQLRVVKDIPAEYKMTVDMHGEGILMDFFDAIKYLNDNGYYLQAGSTGGKPAVFSNNYVILDAYVNGAAYTVTALNWGESNSVPQYTIVENPGQPYIAPTEGQEAIPAGYVVDGIYNGGTFKLPTKVLAEEAPVAVPGTVKNTDLNYCSQTWRIYGPAEDGIHNATLANALVVPQAVPEYVTVVFDICIKNNTGDDIVITNRRISRKINTGKDMLNADYVASWIAANKYVYNFKFDGDSVDFSTSVSGWETSTTHEYHVWDYSE